MDGCHINSGNRYTVPEESKSQTINSTARTQCTGIITMRLLFSLRVYRAISEGDMLLRAVERFSHASHNDNIV